MFRWGTENQFITGYSIHQNANDSVCTIEHLEALPFSPEVVVADAGYGSEENYEYFEKEQIIPFVKYSTLEKEKTTKWKNDPTKTQNFRYDTEADIYYCPLNNKPLKYSHDEKQKSTNGFVSSAKIYTCLECIGCPHRAKCIKSEKEDTQKEIQINTNLNRHRQNAKALLNSDIGIELSKRRSIEVENAFGNIKGNFGLRRFRLKGLSTVKIEYGLWSIAHNMRKLALIQAKAELQLLTNATLTS